MAEILGAVAVLISRLATLPKTFWEGDELLFAGAVQRFDPWTSRPHPPGYPLYVFLGKCFAVFADPFHALVALSVTASVIGFVALAFAFRHALGDRTLAVCGALVLYFSASTLVFGTLPLSDGPALMFIGLALWAAGALIDGPTVRRAAAFGLAASAAIGTRPQLAIPILPLFFVILFWTRRGRPIAAGVASFTLLSAAWFFPLVFAAGGWQRFVEWETRQASYVAVHDAGMSRGASTTAEMLTRFVAHPWGPKWLAIPVLLFAAIGVVVVARRPKMPLAPIALFSIVQFVFAVTVMDPADGPRYSLPHMIGIAFLAGAGLALLSRMRVVSWLLVGAFAGASLAYTWPIAGIRRSEPSPPAAAAAYARAHFPAATIIGYDLSLHPHADHLLPGFRSMQADRAMVAFYDRPDVPVVIYGDGLARSPDAKVFRWPKSDAYGKLTRNHYRVVTLEPLRPDERFQPVRGVDQLERTAEIGEWRWLARDAAIRLPLSHGATVKLTFQLSTDAPYEENTVHLAVNGRPAGEVVARREPSPVTLDIPGGPVEISIHSDQAFAPASILHNQDPRILAVQLIDLQSP